MAQQARSRGERRRTVAPVLEGLEDRRMLSAYTGPSIGRTIRSVGGVFRIQVVGQGVLKVHSGGGQGAIDLSLFGTSSDSTVNITQVKPPLHSPSRYLVLNKVTVATHQLGGLDAPEVELNGTITEFNNSVNTLAFGSIGPDTQLDVNGDVGTLSAGQVNLGPTGHIIISGRLNTTNLTDSLTIGGFTIDGGRFVIGQDSMAPIEVTGNFTISQDGLFSIGRDQDAGISVNGNLELDSGGQLFVGRNLSSLNIGGNLIVNPSGSGIVVNGQLGGLTVAGYAQGQGGTSAPTVFDVGVGLNLTGLTIEGATTSQAGLLNTNIRAGGTISGINIPYNQVNSTIQPSTPPTT